MNVKTSLVLSKLYDESKKIISGRVFLFDGSEIVACVGGTPSSIVALTVVDRRRRSHIKRDS